MRTPMRLAATLLLAAALHAPATADDASPVVVTLVRWPYT